MDLAQIGDQAAWSFSAEAAVCMYERRMDHAGCTCMLMRTCRRLRLHRLDDVKPHPQRTAQLQATTTLSSSCALNGDRSRRYVHGVTVKCVQTAVGRAADGGGTGMSDTVDIACGVPSLHTAMHGLVNASPTEPSQLEGKENVHPACTNAYITPHMGGGALGGKATVHANQRWQLDRTPMDEYGACPGRRVPASGTYGVDRLYRKLEWLQPERQARAAPLPQSHLEGWS